MHILSRTNCTKLSQQWVSSIWKITESTGKRFQKTLIWFTFKKKKKLNFDFNFRWIMCSKFHGISSNCPRTWNKITQEIRNNLTDTLEEIKKCRSLKFKIKKKKLILDIYFHADWKIAAFTKFVRLTMSHRPPVAIRTTEFRNSVWPSAN